MRKWLNATWRNFCQKLRRGNAAINTDESIQHTNDDLQKDDYMPQNRRMMLYAKHPYWSSMLQIRHTGPLSPQAHVSRTNGVAAPPMIAVSAATAQRTTNRIQTAN